MIIIQPLGQCFPTFISSREQNISVPEITENINNTKFVRF
jgi:hypothetical protein